MTATKLTPPGPVSGSREDAAEQGDPDRAQVEGERRLDVGHLNTNVIEHGRRVATPLPNPTAELPKPYRTALLLSSGGLEPIGLNPQSHGHAQLERGRTARRALYR